METRLKFVRILMLLLSDALKESTKKNWKPFESHSFAIPLPLFSKTDIYITIMGQQFGKAYLLKQMTA